MELFLIHIGLGWLGHCMVNGYFRNAMKRTTSSSFDNGVTTFLAMGGGILSLISSLIFLYQKRKITGRFWWGLRLTA